MEEEFLGNGTSESVSEGGLISLGFDAVGDFQPVDQAEIGGLLKGVGEAGSGIPGEDDVDFIASFLS